VVGVAALLPASWFLPDLIGAGDALRSSDRARIPNPGAPALATRPALESLGRALGLMPLAASPARSTLRRAALAALGVLAAALVAALRGVPLPLTGDPPPGRLDLAGAEQPLAVARALGDVLTAHPGLVVAAATLAAAAALLPYARERGPWWIAGLGAGLLASTLLAAPAVAALPVVAATWAMCATVALARDT
jgi:hypothetical protein